MWFKNDKKLQEQTEKLKELAEQNCILISTQTIAIGELRKELTEIKYEYTNYREDTNNRFRKLNNLINEKFDYQQQSNESILIGLQKSFNAKIENLSEGKPLIQDLLKKIAHLEGVAYTTGHRRSTEEIMNKLSEWNDLLLKAEREEKDTASIIEKVNILKWILGEI